ncbi:MAG: sigma-70 family RNA polymerase sigma factor [Peptococcaceae bacterium]|jgi:RNA polymerase sigma factor (sigma-70 family)|nr:sigma-70 family RNA polymerase sigma factor [Candidatus Syntrophopropionicum ammoniitolerans]
MSKFIKIGKERVPVSEEIYKEYYKMRRRERYMEEDIKVGRIDIDPETGEPTFIPSKEDSIERLIELGADFVDEQPSIEDILCDKAALLILQEALKELNHEEQELIQALYHKNLTVREVAKQENTSHVTVIKRRDKILAKLRKFFT